MSTADDLQALAEAAQQAQHRTLRAISELGPRPPSPPASDVWDRSAERLDAAAGHLGQLAQDLCAKAVVGALDRYPAEVARLREVADHARERIRQIARVTDVMTTISRIIDVGAAVLSLAAAPSPGKVLALGESVMALSDQLDPAG